MRLILINGLLDLAKLESGPAAPEIAVFDPQAMIEDVIELTGGLVRAGGNELVVSGTAAPTFRSDSLKLRQILINLLSNAAKFTERGRVTLSDRIGGGLARFEVRDTGIGIPSDAQASVFSPLPRRNNAVPGGMGERGWGSRSAGGTAANSAATSACALSPAGAASSS